ncbi:formin-F-like [Quillaja saponaria]|uniref:Formin-F-like n=1 Tax=Quillaja saponaria TaxID=32244 RepID=A0AAD7PML9_QUISA|nr:formin-F-like [Quillaja saponaria]
MEEEIEIGLEKTMRKRSRSRKASKGTHSVLNVAEARREIAYALHLHRSSSSSPGSVTHTDYELGNISSNCDFNVQISNGVGGQHLCYSLLEPMPLPGPIWSRTPPSVLAEPEVLVSAPIEASLEFELEENQSQSSSYTWWLGFLKTLDGNVINDDKSNYPFGVSKEFSKESSKMGETHSMDASEVSSYSPDEWFMFPIIDEEKEEMICL